MIRVTMFGQLTVHVGERALGRRDLGGVKPRQLLEMLLLQRRAVTKDELIDALWEDKTPRDPVATLEAYVSVLRSSLQPGVRRDASVIATEPGAYYFVRERALIDIDQFDLLTRRLGVANTAERRAALVEACALATGPVLEDERYAEWAMGPRRHYERMRLEALVATAEMHVEEGLAAPALDLAERAMIIDPTCEPAYHAAMRAASHLGRRDMVRSFYDQCARSMRNELGVSPMAVTANLRDDLLQDVLGSVDNRLVGAAVGSGNWSPAMEHHAVDTVWPSSRFR